MRDLCQSYQDKKASQRIIVNHTQLAEDQSFRPVTSYVRIAFLIKFSNNIDPNNKRIKLFIRHQLKIRMEMQLIQVLRNYP
jgi:hypothetical protein